MIISEAIPTLARLLLARHPVFFWSPPGVGKSSLARQSARLVQNIIGKPYSLEDLRLLLLDMTDLRGFPMPDRETMRTVWTAPDFWPIPKTSGVIMFEEMNSAAPLLQATAYQIILDRRCGPNILPDGWTSIGAGNRENDGAVTNRMPSALANRFTHIEIDANADDWSAWALNPGASLDLHASDFPLFEFPDAIDLQAIEANPIHLDIIAFIRMGASQNQGKLHSFDPKYHNGIGAKKAFAAPRSWEYTSRIMAMEFPKHIEFELLQGTIGSDMASEFTTFCQIKDTLPSLDSIFSSPESAKVPDDPSALYLVSGALAQAIKPSNIDRAMTYVRRLHPEFQVITIQDMGSHDPATKNTASYIQWIADNSDLLN
jgi:hypothetical protein